MKYKISAILIVFAVAISSSGLTANASLVLNSPSWTDSIPTTLPNASNAFTTQINALGLNSIIKGTLTATQPGKLEFWYHGQESGWNNSFLVNGTVQHSESDPHESPVWLPQTLPGAAPFLTINISAGPLNLAFSTSEGGQHDIGSEEFGIFAVGTGGIGSFSLTSFYGNDGRIYFGHDDLGANVDDNHDDMIISMRYTAIPEASTVIVWSVLGLIGSVVAYKRRTAPAV